MKLSWAAPLICKPTAAIIYSLSPVLSKPIKNEDEGRLKENKKDRLVARKKDREGG
jgi:hypothetical protein